MLGVSTIDLVVTNIVVLAGQRAGLINLGKFIHSFMSYICAHAISVSVVSFFNQTFQSKVQRRVAFIICEHKVILVPTRHINDSFLLCLSGFEALHSTLLLHF